MRFVTVWKQPLLLGNDEPKAMDKYKIFYRINQKIMLFPVRLAYGNLSWCHRKAWDKA